MRSFNRETMVCAYTPHEFSILAAEVPAAFAPAIGLAPQPRLYGSN